MNLRDLEYAVCLAGEGQFRRAAARCHVSQPTLSAQIAKLEDQLGVQLFERDIACQWVSNTTINRLLLRQNRWFESISLRSPRNSPSANLFGGIELRSRGRGGALNAPSETLCAAD